MGRELAVMKYAVLIAAIVLIALILFVVLRAVVGGVQGRLADPPPPTLTASEATLEAVKAEATHASDQATKTHFERLIMATAQAIQTETANLQTRTADGAATPSATPIR